MQRGTEHLSMGAEALAQWEEENESCPTFDVLIVGSGYGASVAAHRIVKWSPSLFPKPTVALLERGMEYPPGSFPDTIEDIAAHVRMSGGTRAEVRGWRDGLFDLRLGEDVSALVANGLGGGSLINAGVAEEADEATLADPAWPAPWRGDKALWSKLYERARASLGATRWPEPEHRKSQAMADLAEQLGGTLKDVALTIKPPASKANAADSSTCIRCGNCFSGCNVGAKNTLDTTLLRSAAEDGLRIYTGATVLRVSRRDGEHPWAVHWTFSDPKRNPRRKIPYEIRARHVILAAGSFGSSEILLRSQAPGLRFSSALGSHFSTNADVLGAQCGLLRNVKGFARAKSPKDDGRVGPTITHMIEIDRRNKTDATQRVVVQDLTIPAPLTWLFEELITSLMIPQRWTRFNWRTMNSARPDHAVVDPALLDRTLVIAGLGHDGAAGHLHLLPGYDSALHDGNLVVHWPRAGQANCFSHIDKMMLDATAKAGGAYWLRNPLWQAVPDSPLIDGPTTRQVVTVHPLGGCRMADSMKEGVVDPFGRVFDAGGQDAGGAPGRRGAGWAAREDRRLHEGLYVLDGSIIPTSLGINPLLTISAVAEGIVEEWLRDWARDRVFREVEAPPHLNKMSHATAFAMRRAVEALAPVAPATIPPTTRLQFKERMYGFMQPPGFPNNAMLRISIRFDFARIDDLRAFVRGATKTLDFDAKIDLALTTFDDRRDKHHDTLPDGNPGPTRIKGKVKWFTPRRAGILKRMWTTLVAWWNLRKPADLPKTLADGTPSRRAWWSSIPKILPFLKMLSHFGEPRLLDYSFIELEAPLTVRFGGLEHTWPKGTRLMGQKSLVYEKESNPWVQLTEMPLQAHLPDRTVQQVLLRYDETYMIGRDQLPMELRAQSDGVTGLRDLLSLALFFGRVVFAQHFLTFRKPDYAPVGPRRRLPSSGDSARFPDLEFKAFDVYVQARLSGQGRLRLQLTRIRQRASLGQLPGHPVLLLHGFGSGGIQFTHEAIRNPMAQWLARHGREVWVGELRTSIGLPTSKQQWVMDDIAEEDIDALVGAVIAEVDKDIETRSRSVEHRTIDVVAHCIGSAMFCMAALSGKLAGKIRRAVLMQVGPIIHLPRGNRARGYIGNRAQRFFGFGFVNSTVDADATAGEVAMDRVLSTFPYMGGVDGSALHQRVRDSDPSLKLSDDLRHNGRLMNAMRSAGVFAQLFQWKNLHDAQSGIHQPLLDAMPDLLGICNLTTYQQTVQYAFLRRLTNQDGSDAYVTDTKLRSGLGMPILFVQGSLNDVFAPRGTLDSWRLLKDVSGGQQVVDRLVIPGYGHLDCVVGHDASTDVFPGMLEFLDATDTHIVHTRPSETRHPEYRYPSIGPWIGQARKVEEGLEISLGLKVDEQRNPPVAIYTVVTRKGNPDPGSLQEHQISPSDELNPVPCIVGAHAGPAAAFWDEGEAVVRVNLATSLLKEDLEIWICTLLNARPNGTVKASEFVRKWASEWSESSSPSMQGLHAVAMGRIRLEASWIQAQVGDPDQIAFAVIACRQAPLLVDRPIADEGFERLLFEVEHLNHALMIGDQIYADALAASGGVEGSRLRFFDAYREAWTARHQCALMARRPIYMAADDHEFRDDHTSATRVDALREWTSSLEAMWRYEYAAGPAGGKGTVNKLQRDHWYEFDSGGFSTFVCDTRNRRFDDGTVGCSGSRIMQDRQLSAIADWLKKSQPSGRPRFLVMASPIAPVFRNTVLRPEYRVRSDSWVRYPASLQQLFALLVEDGARNLVVIGGDYHCFYHCQVEVSNGSGKSIKFESVACPGIYSPYAFANSEPDEFWEPSPSWPVLQEGPFEWAYHKLQQPKATSGHVRITATAKGKVEVDLQSRIGPLVAPRQPPVSMKSDEQPCEPPDSQAVPAAVPVVPA